MVWICKRCGEKIQGYYAGLVDIDKNGCAIDGTQEEEEVIKYFCGCDEHIRFGKIDKLKKVAEWVE